MGHNMFFLFLTFINFSILKSAILNIPSDYPSIQSGINSSSNGDTIIISDGTYFENLNTYGKEITLASLFHINGNQSHISNTIIDGDSLDHVLLIDNSSNPIINGLTIKGGFTDSTTYGAGILIDNFSNPTIKNCIIKENHARRSGSGISINNGSSPLISHCKIIDNYTPRGGAGIYCKQSTTPVQPEIRNCIFDTNIAGTGGGGGIRGKSTANPSVFDSYFVENSADFGGAISHPFGGNPIIINNSAFCGNTPDNFSTSTNYIDNGITYTNNCDSLRSLFSFQISDSNDENDSGDNNNDNQGNTYGSWIEYPNHAISLNGTGAGRLYLTQTNVSSTDEFREICKEECINGNADGPNGQCGAFVINYFDVDTHLNPNYCVFKLANSLPYPNTAKDSYVYEEIYYLLGDVNLDTLINVIDIVQTVNYIFYPDNPIILEQGDINQDGTINIIDVVTMVTIIIDF